MSVSDARSILSASASDETVLLEISVENPDPAVASELVNAVSVAMVDYVSSLETPANGGDPLAKLTVVTPGSPANEPISPQTLRLTFAGLVGGVLLGVLLLFVYVRLNDRLRDERDIVDVLGASVLATVPSEPPLVDDLAEFEVGGSVAAESYRRLRTNLAFVRVDNPVRSIAVSSPNAAEGKTTTAVNLAAALAESGSSVVLVDADLRRPTVAGRLGVNPEIGLTNILRGDADVADVIQATRRPGLHVLASGPRPPNPTELLGTGRARAAFAQLADRFEYVIVDTPPLLPVIDANVVAQYLDGTLLVLRAGRSRRPDLIEAADRLRLGNVELLGSVLNCVSGTDNRYAYSYHGGVLDGEDSPATHAIGTRRR
ncbi:polysaccharide biosynthesis tyrosine autokinase [Gordonia sp. LSe1-13]|uniref:Polysaccharide biosynthesis tyrosine autokinase n=1 Tax=Gordonia sesuvii TaxID=3116777 RepID=A0ABU7ME82_9ACTN|nr:polysaccharide biosynthesis tyrosine autokinase [Gordonia sp. LSe1-13]